MKSKKHKLSKFGKIVKKAKLSQTDLKEKLAEKGIHKALMTVHRWCTGECKCRDLFIAKELAVILGVDVEVIVESFE